MTLGQRLAWDDTVLPFQLDHADIRGRVARLDGVLDAILDQHDYPPQVEALIAEMALLTALIGQTIKLRWKLSLQLQSKGAIRRLASDYFAPTQQGEPARMRAYASFDRDRIGAGDAFSQLDEGYFAVLIDQGRASPRSPVRRCVTAPRRISPSPSNCPPGSRSASAGPPNGAVPGTGAPAV
jgi:molecular chaperone Hsp33